MASSCRLSIDDFNQLVIACSTVSPHWEELAPYLGVTRPTVEGIQKEGSGQTSGWCLNKLITAWLRQSSPSQPKPSWRIFCDAVSNIDRPLSMKIWTDHTRECSLCKDDSICQQNPQDVLLINSEAISKPTERIQLHTHRQTPVAMAVQQGIATEAAKELENDFDDLVEFLIKEISKINVDVLRYRISQYFEKEEGRIDEEMEKHLMKIEDCDKPSAVLNYFRRHRFIGYVNYALIKVFQKIAKSPLLDKRIEEYEKDYQCFLELSLMHIHDVFQQCPDLRPDYPAGIPKFAIHLKSKWDGKSMFKLKEFLKQCCANSHCVDQLMIAKISRRCIIITFAVLPHIARKVLGYLTNDDVILSMKKEGISVDISKQLMKYEEELETTDSIASMEQTHETLQGLETDPSHSSHTTGIKQEVKQLRKQNKSLENQLVTHKQMMMELDNTRESLKQLTQEHNSARESLKQVTLERDNTRDELKKTKQSMNVLQAELISVRPARNPDLDNKFCEAAENGDMKLLETLIKSGANVNTKSTKPNHLHRTPLYLASSKGHREAVNYLISLGAKVNEKDDMDNTPLHNASWDGHSDIVNTLISHGATINEKDNGGYIPLHEASSRGHSDIVKTLISHGATLNEKNIGGNTPLHYASKYNHSDTVNVLLSNGAIVNSLNEKHQTPLQRCLARSESNITATAELLISHGADLYQEDKDGNSPVLIAAVLGHEDLMLSHGVSKDTISKYHLPEGWEAERASYNVDEERIQYTNTMTGVTQFKHPAL